MAELKIDPETGNPVVVDVPTGASGTNIMGLPQGALAALGGQERVQAALDIAKALQPKKTEVDPALMALLYFTKMGELASQPGATLLGSAAGAGVSPAAYLMQQRKEQREAESKLPTTAVQIATLLKPPAGTGVGRTPVKVSPVTNEDGTTKRTREGVPIYNYNITDKAGNILQENVQMPDLEAAAKMKPETLYNAEGETRIVTPFSKEYYDAIKVGFGSMTKPDTTTKTVGSGTLAKYLSQEDAEQFVVSQGMSREDPNFGKIVAQFVAPNDELIGKPITDGGVYLEAVPLVKSGRTINLQLTPSKSAAAPYFTTYVEKRLPLLAKSADTYNTTAREVLPRVDEAMELLRSGKVETGRLNQALLPFKQVFNQAFGTTDPAVTALESLQATSNFLAPKMRPVGSGSTSDMEFRAYQQAALYIGNTPEANYISLYAFKKMSENGVALNQKEQELLTSGDYSNMQQVNSELNKFDRGLFEKYTGDKNDDEAIQEWFNSLPDGTVAINNGIFNNNSPYIIKGWGQ